MRRHYITPGFPEDTNPFQGSGGILRSRGQGYIAPASAGGT